MELINLKSLNLTMEESRNIINFIAQKRGISTKKLFSTIKTQQELIKSQQELIKSHQKLTKTHKKKHKNTKKITSIKKM